MNHLEEYTKIIDYRKLNPLPKECYGENHHIKPRSIFPELKKDKSNIIRLSAYEHFMCHYHLWKHYEIEDIDFQKARKMCSACLRMKNLTTMPDDIEEVKKLARLYDEVKNRIADYNRQIRKGAKMSESAKRRISEKMKGRHLSDETRRRIALSKMGEKNPLYRKEPWNKNKKVIYTEESWKRVSESHKGKNLRGSHPRSRKILQYDKTGRFIKEWDCIQSIVEELHINQSLISRVCILESYYTAGGFIWRYKKDKDVPLQITIPQKQTSTHTSKIV